MVPLCIPALSVDHLHRQEHSRGTLAMLHIPYQASSCAQPAGLLGNSAFVEGTISGFLLIFFSELGDKTFFIAVLLALKNNKGIVFGGTFEP